MDDRKSRSNPKSIESTLGAMPKIDNAEKEKKPSVLKSNTSSPTKTSDKQVVLFDEIGDGSKMFRRFCLIFKIPKSPSFHFSPTSIGVNLRIIWSKIRDYFGKADKTKDVPIIIDDAYIQKKVEEIKDNRFFIILQREFKKVPKRERKHMKLQFIKFIQEAQPTKYEPQKDEGCFINLMSCIKQEVLLF